MSTATTRLGLVKPASIEQFSLATLNTNYDKIDTEFNTEATERKKVRRAEYTGPAITFPNSSAVWGCGKLTADPGTGINQVVWNNTFVTPGSNDQLKILESGLYLFEWLLATTGLPPGGEMVIKNNNTNRNVAVGDMKRDVSWGPTLMGAAYINANDTVNFYTINRTGGVTGSSRVAVTKLQG